MEKAIRLIIDEKVSVSEVSKRFSIPRSTLRTRLRSNDPLVVKKPGMATALTQDEELEICDWMMRMSKMGHPKAWKSLAVAVKDVLDKMGRRNVFKNNNTPTSGWLQAFKRRHPVIKGIKTREGGISKSKATKEDVKSWFKGLRENLVKENLDPHIFLQPINGSRIFYAEEMRILLQGEDRLSKVLVRKETSGARKMVSAMACMSASGGFLKPLLVFNGKRPPMWQEHPELNPATFDIGFSPTGRMEENVFFYWMQLFVHQVREMPLQKPILLLLYYNTADVTIATLEMAKDAGVVLHMLPPRSSHILQPMDHACFKPLKEAFRESVDYYAPRYGPSINVKLFPLVFLRAWHRSTKRDDVIAAFHSAGLLPLDENAVINKKMLQQSMPVPKQHQPQQHNLQQHNHQHHKQHHSHLQHMGHLQHPTPGSLHYDVTSNNSTAAPATNDASNTSTIHMPYVTPELCPPPDFSRFAPSQQQQQQQTATQQLPTRQHQQQQVQQPPPQPKCSDMLTNTTSNNTGGDTVNCTQQTAGVSNTNNSTTNSSNTNNDANGYSKDFISGLESAMDFVVANFIPEVVRPIYAEWLAEGKSCTPDPMFYVWRGLQDLINQTKSRQQPLPSQMQHSPHQHTLLALPSPLDFVEPNPLPMEQSYEGCNQDFQTDANP